jgi:hypothetical protein
VIQAVGTEPIDLQKVMTILANRFASDRKYSDTFIHSMIRGMNNDEDARAILEDMGFKWSNESS